jgi:Uma2 family endonuclease
MEAQMSSVKKQDKIYTYADYLSWPEEERWEIIDGQIYDMSPAPSRIHQELLSEILRQFANYLIDKPCRVYPAPFDVRFPGQQEQNQDRIINVVQPDITVVCDPEKLDDKGCLGAPDLVIEITSASTAKKDFNEKFHLYESFGVKEYWIVLPGENMVFVYTLSKNKYGEAEKFSFTEEIPVGIFKDLIISLSAAI